MRFEDFAEQHGAALLRLAYVLTGDQQLAEDLTQTALADVYRHWRKVAAARSSAAYARKSLVNAHLSWHRRRWTTERVRDLGDPDLAAAADHADSVANRQTLRAMVAELPPKARTVLVLRYWADLSDAAIAEAMGVRQSTVRATASRALAALRADPDRLEDIR